MLKAIRRGAAWVVHSDDVREYQEKYISKKQTQENVSSEAS